MIRRREFIAGLGSAAALPVVAGAQGEQVRRIGVLMAERRDDPKERARVAAFQQGLANLGWTEERNVRIDYRWAAGDMDSTQTFVAELVGLRLDVLVADGTPNLAAFREATRSIPIVFTRVADPIGMGVVASIARPGGNITGFLAFEPPLAGKWVQLLNQIAPGLRRVAFLFHPELAPYARVFFPYAEAAAAPLMVEMIAAPVHDDGDVEDALAALAREPNGGLVVNGDAFTGPHRERIISVAAQHRLPAIYPVREYATDGGLISYGVDFIEPYRLAAIYVDRILRGAKPADLPVQAPTKFEFVINLKTAKALGLTIPETLLATADEVIQ